MCAQDVQVGCIVGVNIGSHAKECVGGWVGHGLGAFVIGSGVGCLVGCLVGGLVGAFVGDNVSW